MGIIFKFFPLLLVSSVLLACSRAQAESHSIKFQNNCGHGTPQLIKGNDVLSTGDDFTSQGPFSSAIAYLQTGSCGFNGEGCSIVEMTLQNAACAGCGSSTDISLIPPLGYSVPTSFVYYGGCNGIGATCASAKCDTAFFVPDDNQVQVACQDNDVNLLITFCGDGTAPPLPVADTNDKVISPSASSTSISSSTPSPSIVQPTSISAEVRPTESPKVGSPSSRRRCKTGTPLRRHAMGLRHKRKH